MMCLCVSSYTPLVRQRLSESYLSQILSKPSRAFGNHFLIADSIFVNKKINLLPIKSLIFFPSFE